jgi:hypothetical protein
MTGIGSSTNVLLLDRNKARDIGARFPIARDRVFVDRPVPIAVRSTQRQGIGDHRFRPRLQHQSLPLPVEPDLEVKRRVARYMQSHCLPLQNARRVGVAADHLIHLGLSLFHYCAHDIALSRTRLITFSASK